jgi:iron complex transport system substrate-binding protein
MPFRLCARRMRRAAGHSLYAEQVLVWIALVVVAAGCGTSASSPASSSSPPEPEVSLADPAAESSSTFPRTVIDGLNRSVTLVRPPQRIVSLAPKNTEELFALGAGRQVVGVTSYCNYPPEAQQREQIGGFSSKSISLEKVVALRPDLVVSAGEFHGPVIAELDRLNVPVMALAAETVEELYQELQVLGTLVGDRRIEFRCFT